MKKLAAISLALLVGFVAGRFSHQPVEAQAAEDCATENGDVNADGGIDISDAISILGNLFLGDPPTLAPLCEPRGPSGSPTPARRPYSVTGDCPGQDGSYATGQRAGPGYVRRQAGSERCADRVRKLSAVA